LIYTVTLNPSLDRTLHFERVTPGVVNRATATRLDLSGKGVNVSLALRELGVPTVMTGFCAGAFGRILVEGLEAQGRPCAFVPVAGETRSNITVIEAVTGVGTKLNEPGPTVTLDDLTRFQRHLLALAQAGDMCVFCGSLPPGAPDDAYGQLICAVRAVGAIAVLDTSGPALAAGCAAAPDLIKPNVVEAEGLTGLSLSSEASWAEGVAAMRALGPRRVLLTLGAQGALWCDEDGLWLAEPPPIHELSNIGAGDAALAGTLHAWQQGLSGDQIARWAVAVGTAKAMGDGTEMPPRARVESVFARVRVRRVTDESR
jgi:1-phosphofructokinase